METSSPLAAMHPPAAMFGSRDLFHSRGHTHLAANPRASSGTFTLREQYVQKSNSDYFNVKSVRGSSPTASLAADLSANFRIDNDMRLVNPCYSAQS
jgi:M-phase inducer tyrosine phosphatase